MSGGEAANWAVVRRLQAAGLLVGVVGLALSAFGFMGGRVPAMQSWLYGWVFWTGVSLGCLGLTLMHHVIRGAWGLPIVRIVQAGARNLPLMALLFLPVLLAGMDIYPWMQPAAHEDRVLRWQSPYLNAPFFAVRYAVFFAVWIGLTWMMVRWDTAQDRTGDPNLAIKRSNVAAPGLVLYVLTITFAYTDWVMSLMPHWFSTIFGFIAVVGQLLGALAFTVLLYTRLAGAPPWAGTVGPRITRDHGNLLLTLTILWAYVNLSQWLLIWYGNLPHEITYYEARLHGGWSAMGTFLIIAQFLAPFLMLLSNKIKLSTGLLGATALLILAVRAVDIFYIVTPAFGRATVQVAWTDVAALLGIGGLWVALFAWQFRRVPALPQYDPRVSSAAKAEEAADHA